MKKQKLPAALFAAIMILSSTAFAAGDYKIDKVHSNVGFTVKHLLISTVPGRFNDFEGAIHYDANDVSKSSVNMTIKTASVNTDNASRDKDLRSADFFDVEKYPDITFVSKQVKKTGDNLVALGTLTIRGVSKEIELPFSINGPIQDPWGNQRVGAEAATKISRKEYGVNGAPGAVGDEVKISLSVEAARPLAK